MKVYLLLVNDSPSLFYSGAAEPDDSAERSGSAAPGIRGWLEARWHRYQRAFLEADAGAMLWCRRVWDWLHSRTQPDEAMLIRLRSAGRIELHYPESHPREAVAVVWRDYLASRWRRHAICLGYNLLLAPPALILLWPLPGPNMIGYWFGYRAIHHWLILAGVAAVRKGRIPTEYLAEPRLNLPVETNPWDHPPRDAGNGSGSPHQDSARPGENLMARVLVPNSLSLLRIGLAAAFPWAPTRWRGGLVVAAALSDLFDGQLSRALQGSSTFGQILDPVADKLFVGSVLVTLAVERAIAPWELLLLGFRDLVVVAGSVFTLIRHGWGSLRQMPPSMPGKLTTAGQLGFLLLLTLSINHHSPPFRLVEAAVATLSVLAGVDYLRRRYPSTGEHETS